MKKLMVSLVIVSLLIGGFSGLALAESDEPIVMAEGDWPGIRAKNAVVKYVLETIGYEVESMTAKDPILHQGLAQSDIDVHLGSWLPQNTDMRKKYKGKIDFVTQNMTEGVYIMAVPQYVWNEGVKSFADLDKHAEKFEKKLYVGPTGWASSKKMYKAVQNDIYGLGDWEVVNSSQSALMAQIEKSINEDQWICYVGWQPHWMNTVYNTKYLDDPERLFESPYSWVDTLTRKGFEEDYPEAYRFLQQFKISAEANNEWIYEIGYNERDPEEVAQEWIKNNILSVRRWLSLVETREGNDAFTEIEKSLGLE